jgi:PAS domain S-box-containing protein
MDAIIAIDEEQRIVLFNPAAEKIFNCPASEAIRTPIDRFIPQRFRSEHREHIRRFASLVLLRVRSVYFRPSVQTGRSFR